MNGISSKTNNFLSGKQHAPIDTGDLVRCRIDFMELERYVDKIVQEKMIELKEEVKDEIRKEILDEIRNETNKTNLEEEEPMQQVDDIFGEENDEIGEEELDDGNEEQLVLLDESNVDDVVEVLDNKGRGRSASYLVRWSTGAQSRVRVSSDNVRERFKRLRRRYWNRYQAEKEKALRLKLRQARAMAQNASTTSSEMNLDCEDPGLDKNEEDHTKLIKDFLRLVSEVGPENVLNNGYWR